MFSREARDDLPPLPKATISVSLPALMRRWWPETLLVVLVLAAFMGCLGSVELWGKRGHRTAAEAIDTLLNNHWLVAEIQGRPRLEKPPLPRWSIAALMKLTGRRDERTVRLPGALAGALTVALIYAFGLRMGGRELALAAALVLCSSGFFVGELRQASNDGPLAFFTTLALYAAWRQLEGSLPPRDRNPPARSEDFPGWHWLGQCGKNSRQQSPLGWHWLGQCWSKVRQRRPSGSLCWSLLLYGALGLGVLTKGPVILLLTGVTLIPYLAMGKRLAWGLRRLACPWGMLLFLGLSSSWPAAVLLEHPAAARVWALEMTEKTGLSQILEHRRHPRLILEWPAMVLPWTLIALVAVCLPFFLAARSRVRRPIGKRDLAATAPAFVWFPWWWGVGNLALFCCWSVAKPNYYVPCLPGMALLIGAAWVTVAQVGRRSGKSRATSAARGLLQAQWVLVFVAAVTAPVVVQNAINPQRLALVRVDRHGNRHRRRLERPSMEEGGNRNRALTAGGIMRDRFGSRLWMHRARMRMLSGATEHWRKGLAACCPLARQRPR